MQPTAGTRRARFGAFEVDLHLGQLRKHGIRLKLQDQPFQVLALLLEHPGDLVTREEFRQKLWPADTFVDFDTGLNSAIKKLRDGLGDSAEEPRYIQTLPRRGYRFIAPLAAHPQGTPQTQGSAEPGTEVGAVPEPVASSGFTDSPVPAPSARGTRIPWALAGLGILLVLFFAVMRFWNPAAMAPTAAGVDAAPPLKPQPTMGRAIILKHPSANPEANELLQYAVFLIRFQFEPLRARSMLERALQLDPNFTEARTYYAVTYIIAVEGGISNDPGDILRAEEELRRALKEDAQIALAHAMLGAVHFFHSQMDLADEETLQAIRLEPGDLGGEVWLLIQKRFLGNEGAMPAARKLVESEPLFWPSRYVLGELLREQGKTAEAMRAYELVLEQAPQNSTVRAGAQRNGRRGAQIRRPATLRDARCRRSVRRPRRNRQGYRVARPFHAQRRRPRRLAAHRSFAGQRPPASPLQADPEFHGIPRPAAHRTSCKTAITIGSSHASSTKLSNSCYQNDLVE